MSHLCMICKQGPSLNAWHVHRHPRDFRAQEIPGHRTPSGWSPFGLEDLHTRIFFAKLWRPDGSSTVLPQTRSDWVNFPRLGLSALEARRGRSYHEYGQAGREVQRPKVGWGCGNSSHPNPACEGLTFVWGRGSARICPLKSISDKLANGWKTRLGCIKLGFLHTPVNGAGLDTWEPEVWRTNLKLGKAAHRPLCSGPQN